MILTGFKYNNLLYGYDIMNENKSEMTRKEYKQGIYEYLKSEGIDPNDDAVERISKNYKEKIKDTDNIDFWKSKYDEHQNRISEIEGYIREHNRKIKYWESVIRNKQKKLIYIEAKIKQLKLEE